MDLSKTLSELIVSRAQEYSGRPFDWDTFNCVHFVRSVYADVGITFPILKRYELPPEEFHLSSEKFAEMPLGHSVFFKRKDKMTKRYWSHVALVVAPDALMHCTRHLGSGVVLTPKSIFLEVYELSRFNFF